MKEFGIVHELIATLVLQCNILSRRTCGNTLIMIFKLIYDLKLNKKCWKEMDESMTPTSASEINTPVPTPMSTEVAESDQLKRLDEIAEPETSTSLLASRLGFVDSTVKSSGEKSTRLFFSPPSASDDLIPIPQEMQIYLFGALSSRYLKEVDIEYFIILSAMFNEFTISIDSYSSCLHLNKSIRVRWVNHCRWYNRVVSVTNRLVPVLSIRSCWALILYLRMIPNKLSIY